MNDSQRERAARAAVGEARDGMIVGLGTGDTATRAIAALAELQAVHRRGRHLGGVRRRSLANHGLLLRAPDEVGAIDLTIDGADEIDPALRLIKGAGGALTREKLVARASRRLVIVADEDKRVRRLGEKRALPVEILPFGQRWTRARLAAMGLSPKLREGFVSDNGGLDLRLRSARMYGRSGRAGALARRAAGADRARPVPRRRRRVAYIGHDDSVERMVR